MAHHQVHELTCISRGGGRESDGKGGRVRKRDAPDGSIYKAIANALAANKPVGLILGKMTWFSPQPGQLLTLFVQARTTLTTRYRRSTAVPTLSSISFASQISGRRAS